MALNEKKDKTKRDPDIFAKYKKHVNILRLGLSYGFIKGIWNCFKNLAEVQLEYRWNGRYYYSELHNSYFFLCGRQASLCETLDDFFCDKLVSALNSFFGKEEAARIREECRLVMEFPYSHTVYRPSYRSSRAGNYADVFFMVMINALDFATYGISIEQAVARRDALLPGLDNRLALALRREDEKILSLVEEAILGDNSSVPMSHVIIFAVVKSGNKRALELLGRLLLAAKGQEGLRQAIVENCDCGTISSHLAFIKLILDNGLCRFSSVIRAFDTWSGLGYGDQKQKVAEKCMMLAYGYLSDEGAVSSGLDSNDTTEIYLALWALCCRDIHRAAGSALKLLDSLEKYKRLVGWYFITHTNEASYRHSIAVHYLHVRDPEELAWICANLHVNHNACSVGYFGGRIDEKPIKPELFLDGNYPKDKSERIALFGQIEEIIEYIGQKNKKFPESVFPWYSLELSATGPCGVLLSLAAYDRSADLTRRAAKFLPLMNPMQRQAFYFLHLNPGIPEQRAFLLEGLSDKSRYVRELIVNRLQACSLSSADAERLAETLNTRNAGLRKAIITLMSKQKGALIRPVIHYLLDCRDTNQLLAGLELLYVFSEKNLAFRNEYGKKLILLGANKDLSQDVSILLSKLVPGKPGGGEDANAVGTAGGAVYDGKSAGASTAGIAGRAGGAGSAWTAGGVAYIGKEADTGAAAYTGKE
ncbi:MAG: hypothetical protein FWH52_01000, partial [Synergistaceae bacterium]|nr:hypothetical protein [Synergistaceae bacterium]